MQTINKTFPNQKVKISTAIKEKHFVSTNYLISWANSQGQCVYNSNKLGKIQKEYTWNTSFHYMHIETDS